MMTSLDIAAGLTMLLNTVVFYGARYFLFAPILFALAALGLGRPTRSGSGGAKLSQVLREVALSSLTILVFASANGLFFAAGLLPHTLAYQNVDDYGWPWLCASVLVLLFAQDTAFYWFHRLIHSRALFRTVHATHHRSVHPTAWATYSVHPYEALGNAVIVLLLLFVIPIHPLAYIGFQTISTLHTTYAHCGREFAPKHWLLGRVARFINFSVHHYHHHRYARDNYGLYFVFWDWLMGTLAMPADGGRAQPRRRTVL
jgi:lathosterol oxidase